MKTAIITEKIDEFEYKGRKIAVHIDEEKNHFFIYEEAGKTIELPLFEVAEFISSYHSHTTINNNPVDLIEKSVKINDLIFNFKDLENRLKKYKNQ